MRYAKQTAATIAAGALALFVTSCESTDPTVPTDGQLLLTANPSSVVIDVQQGQTQAQATIVAQAFDSNGFALPGVSIVFTSSGGKLESSTNACSSGVCSISGGGCVVSSDCPAVAPQVRKTNNDGIAFDVLTLGIPDPSTVDVIATSGTMSTPVTVSKSVTDGNVEPTAVVEASPALQQRRGLPVSFDARSSSDPDGGITCYQWSITSQIAANSETLQGPSMSTLTRTYSDEQALTITLRVSDNADAGTFCTTGTVADASNFDDTDILDYDIVCDTTAPIARGGPNRGLVLVDGMAEVLLDGGASSDPESGIASHTWTCGNSQSPIMAPQATCTYTFAGSFTATLQVTNTCGQTSTDDVIITVTNPNP